MEKNTLGNNIQDPDRELDFEVLEEIPEVGGANRSNKIQLVLWPLLALIIIAAVPLILSFTAIRKSTVSIDKDFPYSSVESPLLQSAVKEVMSKRREVDLKDVQIRQYQNRVLQMDDKIKLLQGLMEETLQVKETKLLDEFNSILSKERSRLEALGSSEEQINLALDRLKTSLDSRYDSEMAEFRSNEMTAYRQRMDGLQQEKASLELALNSAVSDRQTLAVTLKTDESELLAGLYNEKDFTRIVNAGIDTDLEILRETKNLENYWLDELANQYLGLIDAITARDYNRAKSHLTALESLFDNSTTAELPGIKARNEADRELLRFFSAYLTSLEENDLSALFAESKLLVNLALSHIAAGRYQEADIAWRKLNANWPLMDQTTHGYLKTQSELFAYEVNRYAELSESSLNSGDYQSALSSWISGLEYIPEPVGAIIKEFWQLWENHTNLRLTEKDQTSLTALAEEKEESAARYDTLHRTLILTEREKQELIMQLDAASEEMASTSAAAEAAETRAASAEEGMAAALAAAEAAETRAESAEAAASERNSESETIQTLENRIADLETLLAENEAVISTVTVDSARWHLYGVITLVSGERFIVKPLLNQIPENGSEIRVMKSIGEDRVIHIADGYITSANTARATISLSRVFNTPATNDLIYISTTLSSRDQPSVQPGEPQGQPPGQSNSSNPTTQPPQSNSHRPASPPGQSNSNKPASPPGQSNKP